MKPHMHGRHMRMNVSSRIASLSVSRSDGKTSENAGVTPVSGFVRHSLRLLVTGLKKRHHE